MSDEIKSNIQQIKEIIRECYAFSQEYYSIKNSENNKNEISLLEEIINNLTNQLRILNNAMPALINRIGFYNKLSSKEDVEKTRRRESRTCPVLRCVCSKQAGGN